MGEKKGQTRRGQTSKEKGTRQSRVRIKDLPANDPSEKVQKSIVGGKDGEDGVNRTRPGSYNTLIR